MKLHRQEVRDNIEPKRRRGITPEERRERLEKWENPFRKYNKVRSQIIDPTKQELDTFMQRGEIDFSFNYEAVYKGGSRRGNPTHIRFVIVKGPLALERDEVILRRRRTFKFVNTMCQWCADLKAADLQRLCDSLPDVMLQDFMDYGYKDVRQLVERQQPDDVAAYTVPPRPAPPDHQRTVAQHRRQRPLRVIRCRQAHPLAATARPCSIRVPGAVNGPDYY